MLRYRTLAAALVTALAALPVLRSACDFECAGPVPPVRAAAQASPDSHCPQHPAGAAPSDPVPNGDGCGHDHHVQRMTTARTIPSDAGAQVTPLPPVGVMPVAAHAALPRGFEASPPSVRAMTTSAPLRI
jgi:hypothetical protein